MLGSLKHDEMIVEAKAAAPGRGFRQSMEMKESRATVQEGLQWGRCLNGILAASPAGNNASSA